jgi:DNA primase
MSIVGEVKQRTDIVEVVSSYVTLQKAGRNYKALCPFHSEKHASFFVFPEQQTWHCFGACGIGGDVFSFLMKKEGIDFGQALRLLADRAGVAMGSPQALASAESRETDHLFQLNELAAEYYHHLLLNSRGGEAARSYVSQRKITAETVRAFRLGFSPDSWEALKDYLAGKGYEEKELIEAGLTLEREDGGSYDRFRNRLMFPICDVRERVTGFGARALGDSLPKYINSPQTAVFDKSGSLYGIERAKSAIRQESLAIIVEGYTDVLRAHQHGWQNVVAAMGTSLTERQLSITKSLSRNIALALDADVAGEEATLRSAERYENSLDAEIRVIALPRGEDPDEVIDENPGLWQSLVEQAPPLLDFAFQTVINRVDLDKAKDKSVAIQKLLPLLAEIRDPIRQAHYEQKLARLLSVNESALKVALRRSQGNRRVPEATEATERSRLAHESASSPVEEYCLALLIQYPQLREAARELSAEHFEGTENREIFAQWDSCQDIPELTQKLDDNLLEHLNYLLDRTFPPDIQQKERTRQVAISDCILRLQEMLSKRLETGIEAVLNLERQEEGVGAELAKLEQTGIEPGQRLQEIFVKQKQKTRPKRG